MACCGNKARKPIGRSPMAGQMVNQPARRMGQVVSPTVTSTPTRRPVGQRIQDLKWTKK